MDRKHVIITLLVLVWWMAFAGLTGCEKGTPSTEEETAEAATPADPASSSEPTPSTDPEPSPIAVIGIDSDLGSIYPGETAKVTATAYDKSGGVLSGQGLSFTLDNPVLASIVGTAITGNDGNATVTLTARDKTGNVNITASAGDVDSEILLVVIEERPSATVPASLTLSSNPTSIMELGTATITATVRDKNGALVGAGTNVTFDVVDDNYGSVFPVSAVTNAGGEATTTFKGADQVGDAKITASAGSLSAASPVTVAIVGSDPAVIEFVETTREIISIKGSGGVEITRISFVVKDGNDTPVQGQSVSFSLTGPQGGEYIDDSGDGTPGTIVASTDVNGIAFVTLHSGTVAGPVTVSASIDVNLSTMTVNSSVVSIGGGTPSSGRFDVAATVLNLPGLKYKNKETLITAYLADRFGSYNILEGTTVSFATEGGLSTFSNDTTDANGQGMATVTLRTQSEPEDVKEMAWEVKLREEILRDYALRFTGHPRDGLCSVMVYTRGEEQFFDTNANGIYDDGPGETFVDGNGNRLYDMAEPYVDINGNGSFDGGETFVDANGNGIWDSAESYTDRNGNRSWDAAEPFTDTNGNGSWDPADTYTDINLNGQWDAAEVYVDLNRNGEWNSGEEYVDSNKNGVYDTANENYTDSNSNGRYDSVEPYDDLNGNGYYDEGEMYYDSNRNGRYDGVEVFTDLNGNNTYDFAENYTDTDGDNVYDYEEPYDDANGNGRYDEAEPYVDLNANNTYDAGEPYTDLNGNGTRDAAEAYTDVNVNWKWDAAEPYTDTNGDGHYTVAEPYIDANGNGYYDGLVEQWTDTNNNGRYDAGEPFTDANGSGYYEGADEPFQDANNNGYRDAAESYTDANGNGLYDFVEPFTDANGNGVYDGAEPYDDVNGNGTYDAAAEVYTDSNGNGSYDTAEEFTDSNGNGQYDGPETFTDTNGNGLCDASEPYTDSNVNGQYDPAESFTDSNGNGAFDMSFVDSYEEPFCDYNNNTIYDGRDSEDPEELYIDANTSGQWDEGNGQWDSDKLIFRNFDFLITGRPIISFDVNSRSFGIENGGAQTLRFMACDRNLNPLAYGTKISVSTSTGSVIGDVSVKIPDGSSVGPNVSGQRSMIEYWITITDSSVKNIEYKMGTITVSVDWNGETYTSSIDGYTY